MADEKKWWAFGLGVAALALLGSRGGGSSDDAADVGGSMMQDRQLFGPSVFDWSQMESFLDKLPHHVQPYRDVVSELAQSYLVHPALVYAEAEEEGSWNPDITGDQGHAWGTWQINDRFHSAWLNANPGAWRDPLRAGHYAIGGILVPYYQQLAAAGVQEPLLTRAAIASYNAGPDAVLKAIHAGKDPNSVTYKQAYLPGIYSKVAPLL